MGRRRRPVPRAMPVSIEIENKVFVGSYHVEGGTMTVWYGARRRVARTGSPREKTLARILLLEMVEADLAESG